MIRKARHAEPKEHAEISEYIRIKQHLDRVDEIRQITTYSLLVLQYWLSYGLFKSLH